MQAHQLVRSARHSPAQNYPIYVRIGALIMPVMTLSLQNMLVKDMVAGHRLRPSGLGTTGGSNGLGSVLPYRHDRQNL